MFKSHSICEVDRLPKSQPPVKPYNDAKPASPGRLSRPRLRLNNKDYRERLTHLYVDTIHTQVEIVEMLNQEFQCALKLPQLKKELKKLGLRRNKQRANSAWSNSGRRPSMHSESSTCSSMLSREDHISNEAVATWATTSFDAQQFPILDDSESSFLLDAVTPPYPQTIDFEGIPRGFPEGSDDHTTMGFIHSLFPDLDCDQILNTTGMDWHE